MIAVRENDALGRIEAALARMEQAVARSHEGRALDDNDLKARHQRLCATVSGALVELDSLIAAADVAEAQA